MKAVPCFVFLALHLTNWPNTLALGAEAGISNCDQAALRAALGSGGTVTFECDGTLTLSNTLHITQDTVLDARGRRVTLSGEKRVRVIHVDPGVSLTLLDLTIAFGQSTNGGGIYNEGGNVTLVNCVLATNSASGASGHADSAADGLGGAVFNSGWLTISNCTLRANIARGAAGRLGTHGVDAQDITDQFNRCRTVSPPGSGGPGGVGGNGLGGGIFNVGTALVVNTSIELNQALGGVGGAGGNTGRGGCTSGCGLIKGGDGAVGGRAAGGGLHSSGILTLFNSTFADNGTTGGAGGKGGEASCVMIIPPGQAGSGGAASGAAICNVGTLTGTNVTLAQNRVVGGDGGLSGGYGVFYPCPVFPNGLGGEAHGGAVFSDGATIFANATIWNNEVVGGSGTNRFATSCTGYAGTNGLAVAASLHVAGGTFLLAHTVVGNLASATNCAGPISDGGHNLASDGSAAFMAPGSLNHTDPKLGPLTDQGGPTRTLALLPGSPAIDAGDDLTCPPADQRGVPRPQGAHCDLGAFEQTFLSIRQSADGLVHLEYHGVPARAYVLEASFDLRTWSPAETNSASGNGVVSFGQINPAGSASRFFRA